MWYDFIQACIFNICEWESSWRSNRAWCWIFQPCSQADFHFNWGGSGGPLKSRAQASCRPACTHVFTQTHTLSLSHRHTNTHTDTHTLTHTHTHTHSHTPKLARKMAWVNISSRRSCMSSSVANAYGDGKAQAFSPTSRAKNQSLPPYRTHVRVEKWEPVERWRLSVWRRTWWNTMKHGVFLSPRGQTPDLKPLLGQSEHEAPWQSPSYQCRLSWWYTVMDVNVQLLLSIGGEMGRGVWGGGETTPYR